jgi:hypothetical protein
MWLWLEKEYLSFDYKFHIEDFAHFENETQFAPLAENLARRAADEVRRLSLFSSVHSAARHLAAKSPRGFWDTFHAGIACGLVGESVQAADFFGEVASTDDQRDWVQAAASLAREYSRALVDVRGFRVRIVDVIGRTRHLLRLPQVADISLAHEFTAAPGTVS